MDTTRVLKIGTRDSKLAIWQATTVQAMLAQIGVQSILVPVKSEGDLDLVTPLYAMGVQGVFTKTLDAFLLSNKIDIVVHSFKDVPTQLAQGIRRGAVLPRASEKDLLVFKDPAFAKAFLKGEDKTLEGKIATGSVRRKAQILEKFPKMTIENLRGNVQTRMQKLQDNDWDGAIFAAAGLERIQERPENAREIPWMLPAPAQGAIVVVARAQDHTALEIIQELNDTDTEKAVQAERDFLSTLMGGCSTPISAYAKVKGGRLDFKGSILSLDGRQKFSCSESAAIDQYTTLGIQLAKELLDQGAAKVVEDIRSSGSANSGSASPFGAANAPDYSINS